MLKSKILISLLTGSISLVSLGTITAVVNPTGTSNWIARNLIGANASQAAEAGPLGVLANWIDTTVPRESAEPEAGEEPAGSSAEPGQIDAEASASTTVGSEPVSDGQAGSQSFGNPLDAVASATTQRIESVLNQSAPNPVDAVASASTRLSTISGSTGTSSGTATSPVDVVASASQTKPGSTAGLSPAETKGLLPLEEAIALARTAISDQAAAYAGYEFENEYPPVYEIFLTSGSTAFEIEIHASTGTVLEIKSESLQSETKEMDREHEGESDVGGEHEADD